MLRDLRIRARHSAAVFAGVDPAVLLVGRHFFLRRREAATVLAFDCGWIAFGNQQSPALNLSTRGKKKKCLTKILSSLAMRCVVRSLGSKKIIHVIQSMRLLRVSKIL